jgi:hypothetical protein
MLQIIFLMKRKIGSKELKYSLPISGRLIIAGES